MMMMMMMMIMMIMIMMMMMIAPKLRPQALQLLGQEVGPLGPGGLGLALEAQGEAPEGPLGGGPLEPGPLLSELPGFLPPTLPGVTAPEVPTWSSSWIGPGGARAGARVVALAHTGQHAGQVPPVLAPPEPLVLKPQTLKAPPLGPGLQVCVQEGNSRTLTLARCFF